MGAITRPLKMNKQTIDTRKNENTSDDTPLLYITVKLNNLIEEVAIMSSSAAILGPQGR